MMTTDQRSQKRKRAGKASVNQLAYLVDYMSSHSDFASGRFTGQQGKETMRRHWANVTGALNNMGPPRDVQGWQKAWTDLKFRTRQKASQISQGMKRTGNIPVQGSLNDLEQKIMSVTGSASSLGDPTVYDSLDEPNANVAENQPTNTCMESNGLSGSEIVHSTHDVVIAQDSTEEDRNAEDAENVLNISCPPTLLYPASVETTTGSSSSNSENRNGAVSQSSAHCNGSEASDSGSSGNSHSCAPTGAKRRRTNSEPPTARQQFSPLKEQRMQREKTAIEARERFAEIQEQQVNNQRDLAKAIQTFADNDTTRLELERQRIELEAQHIAVERARIEQDKATSAALLSMAAAVSKLVDALQKG